jgi:ribosome-associated heat shock protein Hsp15
MSEPDIRLDKFLWCARAVKTRELARAMIRQGTVRLNKLKILKPGHGIRRGDVLTFFWSGQLHVWRVNAIPARRGPAAEARLLYDELGDKN